MAASLVFRLHDRGPELVREVLLERGWEEYDEGEREKQDWNLYWRGSTFPNSDYEDLLPWQRLNHHPKTAGITRKDCLARNLRRMRATFGTALYDFSPTAFILPNDYTRFLDKYNKLRAGGGAGTFWICKPVDLSRGRGIFIFQDIKDLVYDCSVIVQRYISNPLLISGYKFDLRIYVCVKSFHPLTVYIHQEGLVRFATEKYDLSSLRNLYAHLTNTSINKLGPFYKSRKGRVGPGCKWTLSRLRHFLHSQGLDQALLWQRINNMVTLTLLTIAPSVPSCPNCVELFGFDVLIDSELKPWLLEVNYSPALTLDCPTDVTVKKGLISDLIDLMNYTLADGLREKAYQNLRCTQPYVHTHAASVQAKRTKVQRRRVGSDPKTLPWLKTEKMSLSQSKRHGFVSDYQRCLLPPVHFNKAADGADRTLNPIPGSQSTLNVSKANAQTRPAPAPWLRQHRSVHVSEVTNRDDTETEAEAKLSEETDVSSQIPDPSPQRLLGVRRPAASWRLPNIYSGNQRPAWTSGLHVPPLRVGDFIRTFPFNTATLKASEHKLEVKVVLRELHKLTAQLASSSRKSWRDEDVKKYKSCEEDFDSLLWGLQDPPLLSQCLKRT